MPGLITRTFYQKYKLYKLEDFFFLPFCFWGLREWEGMVHRERREAGGETRSVNGLNAPLKLASLQRLEHI